MKALRIILIIFCTLLALCGIYINSIYYIQFFEFYGIEINTTYILSISFVLISCLLFGISLYRKKKKNIGLRFLWGLFIFFSIFCSAAGQYQEHLQKKSETQKITEIKKDIQDDITRYTKRLEILDIEKQNLEEEKRATVKSFQDAYNWPRNMKRNDEAQAEKKADILYYEDLLSKAKIKKAGIEPIAPIGIFLLFGKKNADIFKIIYQLFIAILIEIMAPAGIFGIYFFSSQVVPVPTLVSTGKKPVQVPTSVPTGKKAVSVTTGKKPVQENYYNAEDLFDECLSQL